MALVRRRTPVNRTVIIVLVIALVGGLGYYLYKQFFVAPETNFEIIDATHRPIVTNFGDEILRDQRYTQLKTFGHPLSTDPSQAGNPNPFR